MKRQLLKTIWVGAMLGILISTGAMSAFAQSGFAVKDNEGEYLDILNNGRLVARYMYAYDQSTPDRAHETYKPYLHVFDAEGKAPITKGQGGKYTHHRGIFIGWNKIGFGGKTYDRWHMKGGEQVHQKFIEKRAEEKGATFTSVVHWNDSEGQPIIVEERTMAFSAAPAPAYLLVGFSTVLKAVNGDVALKGDPEHAGIQFRPANEVVTADTTYVFPKTGADPKKDKDYPWVGETYTLNGKRYSVVHMNHPKNPKDTVYSAYRDYGRFGAFFTHDLKAGESLKVDYGFVISEGEMPKAEFIQNQWDGFAGVLSTPSPTPSPVPALTVQGGVQKNKKAKKK